MSATIHIGEFGRKLVIADNCVWLLDVGSATPFPFGAHGGGRGAMKAALACADALNKRECDERSTIQEALAIAEDLHE